jgi:hypothetical protein
MINKKYSNRFSFFVVVYKNKYNDKEQYEHKMKFVISRHNNYDLRHGIFMAMIDIEKKRLFLYYLTNIHFFFIRKRNKYF